MKFARREFMKVMAAGAAMSTLATPITALAIEEKKKGLYRIQENIEGFDEKECAILYYASLAPSGHNSQPWAIRKESKGQWVLQMDPTRRLPAVDPNNRELLISLGCFVENLVLAASHFGHVAEVEILAKRPDELNILRIKLTPLEIEPDETLKRLATRRVVKNGYVKREIKKKDMQRIINTLEGKALYYPLGSVREKWLSERAVEAFKKQSERDDAQKELAHWLRFSKKDIEKHMDGLTPAGMELGGFAKWYVSHFMEPKDAMKENFRKQGVLSATEQAANHGGWLVVLTDGESIPEIISAGRRFERMFVELREHNLAVHPMTQVIEEGMWEWEPGFKPAGVLQLVLRIGYQMDYPDPVSPRRPISRFIQI